MPSLKLLLARHGYAEPMAEDDAQRALTPDGRRHARQVGTLLQQEAPPIDAMFTSPLVRAVQTSEIFAASLGVDGPIAARLSIAEPPSLEYLTDFVRSLHADIRTALVVGHQPTVGLLVTALAERPAPSSFTPGSVVCLELAERNQLAEIKWMITGIPPGLIKAG